jgi:2-oxo-4-hydroxy-4-carboxy-5-ureidoimidazoline decarboxylase
VTQRRSAKLLSAVQHLLAQLNEMTAQEFVRIVGPAFEHSPWIAQTVAAQRPFATTDALHAAMCATVRDAAPDQQLALIRAHPDLVGRAVLTAESEGEQCAAGLSDLSAEEVALFDHYNREYKARFDFPFVICARLNKKEAILEAFPRRLQNTAEMECTTALEEIFKIARLRLDALIVR